MQLNFRLVRDDRNIWIRVYSGDSCQESWPSLSIYLPRFEICMDFAKNKNPLLWLSNTSIICPLLVFPSWQHFIWSNKTVRYFILILTRQGVRTPAVKFSSVSFQICGHGVNNLTWDCSSAQCGDKHIHSFDFPICDGGYIRNHLIQEDSVVGKELVHFTNHISKKYIISSLGSHYYYPYFADKGK